MWVSLLIALAPSLEKLIQGVTGVAQKQQQASTATAASLEAQAAALLAAATQHKAKAAQATNILTLLQGLLG